MKALRAKSPSEQPKLETVPIPDLGPKDVLVRVAAAGLVHGPLDILKQGRLSPLPTTPCQNVAGYVEEVGDMVTTVKPG
jgi:S-(hydroxymethyl)glutathione dehydrogenase / alcohol dehydrogenase